MAESAGDPQNQNLPGFVGGGPYLCLAVLCEKVLKEADGILSIIRVVDRMTVSFTGPDAPTDMPQVAINLTALIGFKSGFARGTHVLRLKIVAPTQATLSTVELPMLLEGEDRGANLIVNLAFQAEEEGLYWIDVYVDDVLFTRMPLRVLYQRLSIAH